MGAQDAEIGIFVAWALLGGTAWLYLRPELEKTKCCWCTCFRPDSSRLFAYYVFQYTTLVFLVQFIFIQILWEFNAAFSTVPGASPDDNHAQLVGICIGIGMVAALTFFYCPVWSWSIMVWAAASAIPVRAMIQCSSGACFGARLATIFVVALIISSLFITCVGHCVGEFMAMLQSNIAASLTVVVSCFYAYNGLEYYLDGDITHYILPGYTTMVLTIGRFLYSFTIWGCTNDYRTHLRRTYQALNDSDEEEDEEVKK